MSFFDRLLGRSGTRNEPEIHPDRSYHRALTDVRDACLAEALMIRHASRTPSNEPPYMAADQRLTDTYARIETLNSVFARMNELDPRIKTHLDTDQFIRQHEHTAEAEP